MRRVMQSAAIAIALLMLSGPANAAGDLNLVLQIYDSGNARELIEAEMLAIQDGMLTANGYLVTYRKEPPMYCQPGKLSLTPPQLMDMLRRAVTADPKIGEADPALAILIVLRQTFPCSSR